MRRTLLLTLAGIVATPLWAAEPRAAKPAAPEVDADLLEFLGSLDAEEEGWQEFLEDRPIRAAQAKPAPAPAARVPAGKVATEQVKDK